MEDPTTFTYPTGWNTDTLHHLMAKMLEQMELRYQQRFVAQQEAVSAALSAAEKGLVTALAASDRAVQKAEMAAEKRFEAVNEFRTSLSDQAANFMTRAEADAKFTAVSDRLVVSQEQSREDLKPIISSIDKLRDHTSLSSGKSVATTQMVTGLIALLAILVSIGGFIYSGHSVSPDTNRMNDLVSRMDALSARLNDK